MIKISLPRKGEILNNYYTRDEDIKNEFLSGLRHRKLDAKLQYLEKQQANALFNPCEQEACGYYTESKKLLESMLNYFVANCKTDVNVIALGVGDALKEKVIVQHLEQSRQVHLFFIDFSRMVINVAVKNVCDIDALKETFIVDLMNCKHIKRIGEYIKQRYKGTNFFTLLGNTLGNYPQPVILETLRGALAPGDTVLIDVDCTRDEEGKAVATTHQTPQVHSTLTSKEQMLTTLAEVGIEAADGSIEVEVGKDELFPQLDVVKQYFRFTRNTVVTYDRKSIYFAAGERIVMSCAKQYSVTAVKNLLTGHGLRIAKHAQEGTYHQLLCELA